MGFLYNDNIVKNVNYNDSPVSDMYVDDVMVMGIDPNTIYDNWEYIESLSAITLTKYIGTDEGISIPSSYNNKSIILKTDALTKASEESKSSLVTIIMDNNLFVSNNSMANMFNGYNNLQTVKNIPDSVTNMDNTFKDCTSLVCVPTISNSVESATNAFRNCTNLKIAPDMPDSLINTHYMYMDSGILSAPKMSNKAIVLYYTFSGCNNIVQIDEGTIPETVVVLDNTFSNCKSLKNINIPDYAYNLKEAFANSGVEKVEHFGINTESLVGTFKDCTNLTSVCKIPDSVVDITNAFAGCTNLINIESAAGNNTTLMYSTYADCYSLENVPNIPNSVINMSSAFKNCNGIVDVPVIGNKVQDMSDTFYGCINIANRVDIPDSVTNMSNTFGNCTCLTEVKLSNKVTNLCNTFANSGIEKVYINKPGEIEADASNMFYGTDSKETMFYIGDTKNTTTFYNSVYLDTDGLYNTITVPEGFNINDYYSCITNDTSYVLANYTNKNNDYVFVPTQYNGHSVMVNMAQTYSSLPRLKEVKFLDPDEIIYGNSLYYAYNESYRLSKIPTIPDRVTNLAHAFANTRINNISIPNSVTSLFRAFAYSDIETIDIPDSVIDMNVAFYNCNKLKRVNSISNNVAIMDQTFTNSSVEYVADIHSNKLVYMNSTFMNCTNLKSIPNITSNSVQTMNNTYYGCTNIKSVESLPPSVTSLCGTFSKCTNLRTFNAIIHNNIKSLPLTFQECTRLTGYITIEGTNVTNIYNTFNGTSLTKYVKCKGNTYNNALTYWNGKNGVELLNDDVFNPNMFDEAVFDDNTKTVTIAKYNSTSNVVSIPSTYIGYDVIVNGISCFEENKNIKEVYIADGVSINNVDSMFTNCTTLTKVEGLPNSITSMNMTYYGCVNLVDPGTLPVNTVNMYRTFTLCKNLVNAPVIPNGVVDMTDAFWHCHKLSVAPVLPNTVKDLSGTFASCYSLVNAPVIPNSVVNMRGTFQESNSITQAPEIPNKVTNMYDTFFGCTNLYGNINIRSNIVSNAYRCFHNCTYSKTKKIYVNRFTTTASTFSNLDFSSYGATVAYFN